MDGRRPLGWGDGIRMSPSLGSYDATQWLKKAIASAHTTPTPGAEVLGDFPITTRPDSISPNRSQTLLGCYRRPTSL